jgi:hypothetical protein
MVNSEQELVVVVVVEVMVTLHINKDMYNACPIDSFQDMKLYLSLSSFIALSLACGQRSDFSFLFPDS